MIPKASLPRWMLAKKLGRAKRVWKSFTRKVQSKLHDLNIPTTSKATTQRLLNSQYIRFLIPSKLRALTKPSGSSIFEFSRNQRYKHHYNYHSKLLYKKSSTIHIDDVFANPAGNDRHTTKGKQIGLQGETSRGKERVVDDEGKVGMGNYRSVYSVEEAWQAVVARSPQLRVVDERAEEFIYKFRQDMKLQKEKSLLEFQEMLARSS